jgi:hypothetical protein
VLTTLVESKLVTSSDVGVMQVIAEHVALNAYNLDEGQQNGREGDSGDSA